MIENLTIKNFGLIEHISLDFDKRLNILTGETGAGKSILIEGLRILLGERMSASHMRDTTKSCVLEGEFNLVGTEILNHEVLQDFLLDDDPTLILQRIYKPDGRNKIKVNGFSVTVSQLRQIGSVILDFHGPHDHQMLLDESSHISLLDRMIDFKNIMEEYRIHYTSFTNLKQKLQTLQKLKDSRDRDMDLLSHQVKELEQVELSDDKYYEFMQEQSKIKNAEKLHGHIKAVLTLLDGGSAGSSETIRKAFHPLNRLTQLDDSRQDFNDRLADIQGLHDELILDLRDYASSLSFDEQESENLQSQCDLYEDIKRKYGPSLLDAQKFYEEAKRKLEALVNLEHDDAKLNKELESVKAKLTASAKRITTKRQQSAKALESDIEKELCELGMPAVKFQVHIQQESFHSLGWDNICFYISPNAGESLKPLAEIVSSGEAARVMLALKKALIKVDPIAVLVFDEIDAQIGGRLGTIIGGKLRDISLHRQVLLITHLPQIASFANKHFKISKKVRQGRAQTQVIELNKEQRVEELAQMMSGDNISKVSFEHANDMLLKAAD